MGVVNEAVEDGVGICRIAYEGVPFVDGDLAGEDGRAAAVTFLEDLVEVTTGAGVERFEAPIVGGIRPGTGVRIRLPPAVSPANFDTTRAGRRLKEGMAVGRAAAGDRGLTERYKNGR
jgi:hypothetical protein